MNTRNEKLFYDPPVVKTMYYASKHPIATSSEFHGNNEGIGSTDPFESFQYDSDNYDWD